MERRTLVRLLVVLAIGIPVLIEVVTFFGLVESQLSDGPASPTATAGDGIRRVGVGDELLPATPQNETVTEAVIQGDDTPWVFVLTVAVDNPTGTAYELRLRTLALGSGQQVSSDASTGRVPSDDSGQVTGAWEIPPGSTPDAVEVVTIEYAGEEERATRAWVDLASVPVRGS